MKNVIYIVLTCLMVSILGCKKKVIDPTAALTKSELMSGKTSRIWQTSAIKVDGKDTYTSLGACYKDNQLVFKADGTYERNSGPSKCKASEPQIIDSGKWNLKSNDSELVMGARTFQITELSNNQFTIKVVTATDQTVIETFTAQTALATL